jgi:hypothetical protein
VRVLPSVKPTPTGLCPKAQGRPSSLRPTLGDGASLNHRPQDIQRQIVRVGIPRHRSTKSLPRTALRLTTSIAPIVVPRPIGPNAGGIPACSRWLSETIPPATGQAHRPRRGVSAFLANSAFPTGPLAPHPGCDRLAPWTGGIARASLNHRLQAYIPPGCYVTDHAQRGC